MFRLSFAFFAVAVLEIGTHRFFARLSGKPEQETETGNFMILWKKAGSRWVMAESVSYGHKLKE